MMCGTLVVVVAIVVQGLLVSPTHARKWTDATGSFSVEAELVKVENGNVVLKKQNGKQITVPLARLSAIDREFVRAIADRAVANQLRLVVQTGKGRSVQAVAFSADGKRIVTGGEDMARIWDADTRKELRQLKHHGPVSAVAYSPDSKRIVTVNFQTARIWDANTGKELRQLEHVWGVVTVAAFSPDSKRIVTGSVNRNSAVIWDADTGKELFASFGHTRPIRRVAFSPDGKRIVTGSYDNTARIWDTDTGKELRQLKHRGRVSAVAYSPDGKRIFTHGTSGIVQIWDANTGHELRQLNTDTRTFWAEQIAYAAAFSPDGKRILTGSQEGTARVWDADTGRELCQLVIFNEGWAVVDSDGRYDASNGGIVEGMHWVIGNEPIALDQLKERYYEPGLLAKVMGFNKEPLREVQAFSDPKLYPEIKVAAPTKGSSRLTIDLKQRNGGIGKVVVKINGKELTADARRLKQNAQLKPRGDKLTLSVDLANDPRLKPGEENEIEVYAYNEEGYLSSRGVRVIHTPSGKREVTKPDVWAIVAGVSNYRGDAIDLTYAAKDADDFATALRVSASRLFGADKLHLTLLSTTQEDTSSWPTKANISKALSEAKNAKPGDILVIYLAGHGVNLGGQDGDFHYLTSEARSDELKDTAVREQVALSSQKLTEAIKQIPALKQVMILDTCASGRVVQKLTEKRQISSGQIRALERVKDRTGMYVLAGCAADAVSYEASNYGQGLLTHSLLLGMRGAALREESYVDVASLFNFAADQVPQLAQGVGGIQRPVIASPKGGASFDIGQVSDADKESIPLQSPRPMILRATFLNSIEFEDTLGLAKLVNEQLRDVSSRGQEAPLVFLDATELPSAFRLSGLYQVQDDKVTVTMKLSGGEDRQPFPVEGKKSDLEQLVKKIVEETQSRLPRD